MNHATPLQFILARFAYLLGKTETVWLDKTKKCKARALPNKSSVGKKQKLVIDCELMAAL